MIANAATYCVNGTCFPAHCGHASVSTVEYLVRNNETRSEHCLEGCNCDLEGPLEQVNSIAAVCYAQQQHGRLAPGAVVTQQQPDRNTHPIWMC
jgi:hypothetical protein